MKIGERKLNLLMDLYQLTMSQGYYNEGLENATVAFDMFFRKIPNGGGYAIFAGLEQVVEYIQGLVFSDEEIKSLKEMNIFKDEFLNYLKNFKFKGDVYSVPEGTVIFPYEPLITVVGNPIEAQLIETMLLLTVNHQSLIATKASRIVQSAKGRDVLEFGARRSQGYDGAMYGARASYIGGVKGTATTLATPMFNIPSVGTMAHSWVQLFEDEYSAFKAYATSYPDSCSLLVDTYDVLKSGVPNVIKLQKEVLDPLGKKVKGIRIDSGDIAYLSKQSREMLDNAGLNDCKIIASNSLDEYTISTLLDQEAKVDVFGVGERLITSKSEPVFGGVYKLVAADIKGNKELEPRIKISGNIEKITNPGLKEVFRLYDNSTGKAIGDIIAIKGETIDESKPYTLFDPTHTWLRKSVENYRVRNLQVKVFDNGKLVYTLPSLDEIRGNTKTELDTIWPQMKRFNNPHKYHVDLSEKLWNLKDQMLKEKSKL
ncbi:MAG: nicotinate phosphoribosyltransferase [Peptostreptococcaceae bacterium]